MWAQFDLLLCFANTKKSVVFSRAFTRYWQTQLLGWGSAQKIIIKTRTPTPTNRTNHYHHRQCGCFPVLHRQPTPKHARTANTSLIKKRLNTCSALPYPCRHPKADFSRWRKKRRQGLPLTKKPLGDDGQLRSKKYQNRCHNVVSGRDQFNIVTNWPGLHIRARCQVFLENRTRIPDTDLQLSRFVTTFGINWTNRAEKDGISGYVTGRAGLPPEWRGTSGFALARADKGRCC